MSQSEIVKYLKEAIKTSSVRKLAKELGIAHHASLFYWLNGGGMSVKNLEQLQKGIKKCQSKKRQ